jgi:hypothetical protein
MGADNWAICPKCERERDEMLAAQEKEVNAMYGRAPADEYLKALAKLHADQQEVDTDDRLLRTLREDYEIGVLGDELVIVYNGGCKNCGLRVTFRHTKPVFE